MILALNCGSSSVKFALFDASLQARFRGYVERLGTGLTPRMVVDGTERDLNRGFATHAQVIPHIIAEMVALRAGLIGAVGHRVVHGGTVFGAPVLIDADVRAQIASLAPLAPAHQLHNLAGIDAVTAALPGVPQVACFDTAFHRTIPEHRQLLPVPQRFADAGLRRFGFHGLSYEYVLARLRELAGVQAQGRVVICHLGNGCSLAGLVEGRSQYTSMGFTPLDGLIMGRRPGRLDPGAVLWLVEQHDGDWRAVARLLNEQSGLLGVSGMSPDMRTLLGSDEPRAKLAVDMFVDRLAQEIAAACAAIGGVDHLVFTGGIGEHAPAIRARTLAALGWLGFELDANRNDRDDQLITREQSVPMAHVIATDEEFVLARAAASHLREGIWNSPRYAATGSE